jgi:hypothetical protein
MPDPVNARIGARLEEVARLLEDQGANRFRVRAYRRAAETLRFLRQPVSGILAEGGLPALEALPGIGESLARSIRDLCLAGRLPMLDRLRGRSDPVDLLATVPGVGRRTADRLHHDLGIDTLEQLEAAAHDGRLSALAGVGEKRLAGIRDSLAQRLGRVRRPEGPPTEEPPVAELLDVDREYREKAAAGMLPTIAPKRFNPGGEAWLPVLHTSRGARHYTVLYSNTPRAHRAGAIRDWVVIYHDGAGGERQATVITARRGPLRGLRMVSGREQESTGRHAQAGEPAATAPPAAAAAAR